MYFVHADHLGAPQKMTDGAQALVWDAIHTPFGRLHGITGPAANAQRLPGQLFDPETGYHQNWHRDYDPQTGRYLQSDPIGLRGGINTYAYALANPLSYIDPDGLNPGVAALPLLAGGAAACGVVPVVIVGGLTLAAILLMADDDIPDAPDDPAQEAQQEGTGSQENSRNDRDKEIKGLKEKIKKKRREVQATKEREERRQANKELRKLQDQLRVGFESHEFRANLRTRSMTEAA